MDAHTLAQVMGNVPGVDYQALLPGYEGAMRAASINTPDRAAMFAAQIGHESSGLRHMEEIASGAAYEGRKDLGNIYPGDGVRFKGSGPIQLTGRSNFRAFTRWANAQGHARIDFEAQPHLVREDPRWGFLAASWYWTVARPQINSLADRRDLEGVTRAINGGLNGLADRRSRYNRALSMGARLLPGGNDVTSHETLIEYSRDNVTQLTPYNCGPASAETVIFGATNTWVAETQLAKDLGTHRGGTDWIGQFPAVLNRYIPGSDYRHVEMPNDPPSDAQKERLWTDLTASVNAGHGVIINIVAPPSNYPRAVAPSTVSPAYGGGVVYHYIAGMGYAGTGAGRRVWIADSGFSPYGYWISFDQLATLVPPKGYAYSAAPSKITPKNGETVILTGVSADALNDAKIAAQAAERNSAEALELLENRLSSLINPKHSFTPQDLLRLIDAATWESRKLMEAVALKVGLDPVEVVEQAILKDRGN